MDKKLTRQINGMAGDQFNFQPGRTHGILGYITGKNATGKTATDEDFGSVVVTRDGRQIANVKISTLCDIADIRFGSNLFSSTVASTVTASFFLPFSIDESFPNALDIQGDSELNFEYVPASSVSTTFDNLSIQIYAELAAYPEAYEPYLLRDDQIEGGAVAGKPYQLNKNNIAWLFLRDPSAVVSLVQLEQNGRQVVSSQPWNVLLASTLKDNRLETSTFDMVAVQAFSKGNGNTLINRDSVLSLTTSGSGTIEIVTHSIKRRAN